MSARERSTTQAVCFLVKQADLATLNGNIGVELGICFWFHLPQVVNV